MSGSRLRPLQSRILRTLAGIEPPWTLTGGGALAGIHLGHRETRDLDLFWRNRGELGSLADDVATALRADGLAVLTLRTAPAFGELKISDGVDACVVDLVAEPFGPIAPPERATVDGVPIAVDGRHEILASKLATLLERSELRDLADVKALLDAGGNLEAGLRDAPKKDAGFSPLTLAWVLKDYDPRPALSALRIDPVEAEQLLSFRLWLIERLAQASAPE